MTSSLHDRVLDATFAEVAANGLRGLTVEAVASRAGSSRATIYRHFPGGRDELVTTTIRREVERFFDAVDAAVPVDGDVQQRVVALVVSARRLLDQHEVLQRLLEAEAEAIVPSLATVHPMIQASLATMLVQEFAGADLEDGVDATRAADHCARMLLSYIGAAGTWDLDHRDAVDAMVRGQILAGVVRTA